MRMQNKSAQRHWTVARVVGLAVVLGAWTGVPAAQQSSDTTRKIREASGFIVVGERVRALESLPVPPAESPPNDKRTCTATELRFADDDAKSEWALPGYSPMLNLWAILHYGARAGTARPPACMDLEFSAQRWQAALGEQPTGQLTRSQVLEFTRRIDANAPSFANARGKPIAKKEAGAPPQPTSASPVNAPQAGRWERPFSLFYIAIGQSVTSSGLPQCNLTSEAVQVATKLPKPARTCRASSRIEWDTSASRIGLLDSVYVNSAVGEAPSEGLFNILIGTSPPPRELSEYALHHQLKVVAVNGRIEGFAFHSSDRIKLVAMLRQAFGPPQVKETPRGTLLTYAKGNVVARTLCPALLVCRHTEILSLQGEQYMRDLWAQQDKAAQSQGGTARGPGTDTQRPLPDRDAAAREQEEFADQLEANERQRQEDMRRFDEMQERQRAEEEAIRRANEQRQRQVEQWEAEERMRRQQ